jgi:hypothetical protein
MIMRKMFCLLCLGILAAGSAALAKTPDGKPPSVETVCDGQTGAAFGLCNAYCEAMDCDSPNHKASDEACAQVKKNYERKTGQPLPCEVVCPCVSLFPLFAALANGTAQVDGCAANAGTIGVTTPDGTFAMVNGLATPPFCDVNLEPPFIELTSLEAIACRSLLLKAAEAQGVSCAQE